MDRNKKMPTEPLSQNSLLILVEQSLLLALVIIPLGFVAALGWPHLAEVLAARPEGMREQREVAVGERQEGELQLHPRAPSAVHRAVEVTAQPEDEKYHCDTHETLLTLCVDVLDLGGGGEGFQKCLRRS